MDAAIPPFLAFSEGLMAGLAARPHEWESWEITEYLAIQDFRVLLSVKSREGTLNRQLLSISASPSESVTRSLQKPTDSGPKIDIFVSQFKGIIKSKNSRGAFYEKKQE